MLMILKEYYQEFFISNVDRWKVVCLGHDSKLHPVARPCCNKGFRECGATL